MAFLLPGLPASGQTAQRMPDLLAGTRWRLDNDSLNRPSRAASQPLLTLQFDAGGKKLRGRGPCNALQGPYRSGSGRSLRLGPLSMTWRSCPLQQEESRLLALLNTVRSYARPDDSTLLLRDLKGRTVLTLRADR
jgi:heat shock protein HslJ